MRVSRALRRAWFALVIGSGAIGCASSVGSERPLSTLELGRRGPESPGARLWLSSTDVRGGDGIQGGPINTVSAEVSDLVNRAMVDQLRRGSDRPVAFTLSVPADETFGSPVTLPPSHVLQESLVRSSVWSATPPTREWSAALRNDVELNVFSDTVELQLASVLTVFDASGAPYWQAAARSRKYYDSWTTGEHLAALAAKFVVDSSRENAERLLRHAR